MLRNIMTNYKEKLKNITTFIFDYDGVMTDGTLVLQHEEQPLRSANVKDGYVLQLAIKLGYRIVIISGGFSKSVENRFGDLNIKDVYLGVKDKTVVYNKYVKVLVENQSIRNPRYFFGRTPFMQSVYLESNRVKIGEEMDVKITSCNHKSLYGIA